MAPYQIHKILPGIGCPTLELIAGVLHLVFNAFRTGPRLLGFFGGFLFERFELAPPDWRLSRSASLERRMSGSRRLVRIPASRSASPTIAIDAL